MAPTAILGERGPQPEEACEQSDDDEAEVKRRMKDGAMRNANKN